MNHSINEKRVLRGQVSSVGRLICTQMDWVRFLVFAADCQALSFSYSSVDRIKKTIDFAEITEILLKITLNTNNHHHHHHRHTWCILHGLVYNFNYMIVIILL